MTLAVGNGGPGIAGAAVGIALMPGGRLDEAQPVTGPGCAIVSDLIELDGGSLTLSQSALGGLRSAIRLPGRH